MRNLFFNFVKKLVVMKQSNSVVLILATILVIVIVLISIRGERYQHENPVLLQISKRMSLLHPSYGDIPLREGDSSFTENKQVITLCIRDPETKRYYDMNTLVMVALHELAHCISTSVGHGKEFKERFAELLQKAEKIGIYDPLIPMPKTYCGLTQK